AGASAGERSKSGGYAVGHGSFAPLVARMPGLVGGNIMRVTNASDGGLPAKWMYVKDWYVLGPFPNPDRVNLRRRFPPESVVDLDATYVGKGGATISWKFMQAENMFPRESWMSDRRALVVPSREADYTIWYAYAEVFSDADYDCWIAVGSDDRSDIWLNDTSVWESSNKLKAWRIDEGFRRVRFKKGRNRILARIENGWHVIGWSLCVYLGDGNPPGL
ncbi:MAG: hypothetical protein IJ829_01170, partial [Kiritimatiellae bacterium]|nr:hypothetical protein [Kiritimatiellia bacterium]